MTTTTKPGKAPAAATISLTPGLDRIIQRDPDIVDRLFAYLLEQMPELSGHAAELSKAERALRTEFRAERGVHVRSPRDDERREIRDRVRQYPAGTTCLTIARELGVSRWTVMRVRQSMEGVQIPP